MKTIPGVLVTLLIFALSVSCGLKKRLYLDGYFIEAKKFKSHKKFKEAENHSFRSFNRKEKQEYKVKLELKVLSPLASVSGKMSGALPIEIKKLGPDSCGDLIYFKDGKNKKVKLVEVDSDFVIYKTCDQLSGPLRKEKKSKLIKVSFQDGRVMSFVPENSITKQSGSLQNDKSKNLPGSKKNKKAHWLTILVLSVLALATLILALSGVYVMLVPFFVLLCAALIFS